MQLVGFRLDQKGRLVGEAWVPKAGLSGDEFLLYVERVERCQRQAAAQRDDADRQQGEIRQC